MSKKFFQTKIEITVWSEDVPIEFDNLGELEHMIDNGTCKGQIALVETKSISEKEYQDHKM